MNFGNKKDRLEKVCSEIAKPGVPYSAPWFLAMFTVALDHFSEIIVQLRAC